MCKRVKYVTAHAQKFSDITICILVLWYMYFTYPNFSSIQTFFWQLVQWGSDNRGCTVSTFGMQVLDALHNECYYLRTSST